jgi:uncharacterized protein (TIGR02147 family)
LKINFFDYFDYRTLMRDLYRERKGEDTRFSYRHIAQKAGFSSAGFFTKVIQGKSNISLPLIFKFAEVFKLTQAQTNYFELLVLFNQATSNSEKRHYFEKIVALRKSKMKTLDPVQFELFGKWYYVAVRELLDVCLFNDDYKDLAKKVYPPIKPSEAKEAIETLEKLRLIRRDPNGYYKRLDAIVSSGDAWESLVIQKYQSDTIELAREALYAVPKTHRDISTLTLSISESGLQRVKEKIKLCRRELLEIAKADENADRVYQLNLQLFPLSAFNNGKDP